MICCKSKVGGEDIGVRDDLTRSVMLAGSSDTAAMEYVEEREVLLADPVSGVVGAPVAMDVDAEGSGISIKSREVESVGGDGVEGRLVTLVGETISDGDCCSYRGDGAV